MEKEFRCEDFIRWMEDRLGDNPRIKDKGAIARLKRADNPDLAPRAWDILFKLGIPDAYFDIALLVGAAMCRQGEASDGNASLGQALASCNDDREQGSIRLRRITQCHDGGELRAVLRNTLKFIASRAKHRLCYARLFNDLVKFEREEFQMDVKKRWTQDFWNLTEEDEENA